ncbi:BMP-binding endothelial regulator protein-like isoform X1 [Rhopilema esculentum]|uniref:BMP-binding endothelial regulator protein-like isoform X1 n=2 Tax=Rhopilema esculentum TaxID=499914 RepID=UPI0031D51FD9
MRCRRILMTSPVVDLLLVNLSLRLVIVMAKPQVQQDYTKCLSGESDKIGSLFPAWYFIPCLECVCFMKDGAEVCQARRVQCPQLKCKVFEPAYSNCCRVCKGCFYNGTSYKDGESWTDKANPCQNLICREGIVSKYLQRCPFSHATNSSEFQERGSCCPSIKLNTTQDIFVTNNSTDENLENNSKEVERPLADDPCILCKQKNGSLSCRNEVCPVLPCKYLQPRDPTKCCRECDDKNFSPVYIPDKWCLISGKSVEDGKWHRKSNCELCQCLNGTALCQIETCPKLNCKPENLVFSGSRCCPKCRDTSVCMFMGKKYSNGDKWFLKGCVECNCKNGRNFCRRQLCQNQPTSCPTGQTLGYNVGSCCKACVEKKHHCVTFGDPHYQTFDGKFYSFQGTCKYHFVKETNNTFGIHVRNSERYTGRFSWTKTVLLKFGKYSISLQQKLKVRLNGKKIRTPYLEYPYLDIRGDKRYVSVYTNIGVTVKWDGDSYLSVSISSAYMNRVSGLCGNFNGNSHDDLHLSNGYPGSPKAFALEWLVGKDSSCHQMYKAAYLPRNRCLGFKLRHAHKTCRIFRDPKLRKCHMKVNPAVFQQSCIFDVCGCPFNARCECSAIKAYMAECKRRVKGKVSWKSEDTCNARCGGGSRFSYCGPGCKPTCKTYRKRTKCNKPCVQGCHCNAGYVWHRNRCVLPRECPRK